MKHQQAIERSSARPHANASSLRIAFTHNLQTSRVEGQAEYDTLETVDAIADCLGNLGHDVSLVDVGGSVATLVERLTALAPDLIFNTAEGTRGRCREAFYPALFEQLGLPFTGSDAHVCTITLDKSLTKQVVTAHGVRVPRSILVDRLVDLVGHGLRFPVILKPNFEGSSVGISAASIVETEIHLKERTLALLSRYPAGVLAEEYVHGIDVVVPFLEGVSPHTGGVLEPSSYSYRREEDRAYNIYDFERKMSGFCDLVVETPARISAQQRAEAIQTSRTVVEALRVRDLARIDYRLGLDGRLYFLEINALPSLEAGASIYAAASLAGYATTESVIAAVIERACHRYGIAEACW